MVSAVALLLVLVQGSSADYANGVEVTDRWLPAAERVSDPNVRQKFLDKINQLKGGDSKSRVANLLGAADQKFFGSRNDPLPLDFVNSYEAWTYGTNGPGTLPTLGVVRFDINGRYVIPEYNERDAPPPPTSLISEAELRKYMRLIHRGWNDSIFGTDDDPLRVIRIVNALHPLGKERALALIREYDQVMGGVEFFSNRELFYALRILFEFPDSGFAPPIFAGAGKVEPPKDSKSIPLFPVLLIDDVPLWVPHSGGGMSGPGSFIREHLADFEKRGVLRAKPLRPPDNVRGLFQRFLDHPQRTFAVEKPRAYEARYETWTKIHIQLDELLRTAMPQAALYGQGFSNAVDGALDTAKVRWDEEKCMYVPKSGKPLAQLRRPLPQTQFWHNALLDENRVTVEFSYDRYFEATVTLTRLIPKGINEPHPKIELWIYVEGQLPTRLSIPSGPAQKNVIEVGNGGNENGWPFPAIAATFHVAKQSNIRFEISIGGQDARSPTYLLNPVPISSLTFVPK